MQHSVYTPGAGNLPKVLAGRDALLQRLTVLLNDVASVGRLRAQDLILVGPRGVGKTVTLTRYGQIAASRGFEVVNLQAVAGRDGLVESLLQRAASRIASSAGPWTRAKKAFDRVANVSVGIAGVSAAIGTHSPAASGSRLDPSTLAEALVELATEVRRDQPLGGVLITVDELQVGSRSDLALLAAMLHRINVDFPDAAVMFAGTGLPHTPTVLRRAGVTHPDRLFLLEDLPVALPGPDALFAVVEPARQVGVAWHPAAAAAVVAASNGYPAHLQHFAHITWEIAPGPTIEPTDAARALPLARAEISRRTLGPRWDNMPDRQMEYMAALALHGGRATSNSIARTLGRTLSELSSLRDDLIREGDIYSPQRGYVALTMPTFNAFILDRYHDARDISETPLLTLEQMQHHRVAGET